MSLQPYLEAGRLEAGCDEAGRGCLAGPVFAAAVILPPEHGIHALNDSKQLKEPQRAELRSQIEAQATAWAVAMVSPEEIDRINILNASFLAMEKAVLQLSTQPDFLLIDGNRFRPTRCVTPFACKVKGDSRFQSIAAASILAKTHRDAYMIQLHEQFPSYGWSQNKGYPTKAHREAIAKWGPTVHHRKGFNLLGQSRQTKLF